MAAPKKKVSGEEALAIQKKYWPKPTPSDLPSNVPPAMDVSAPKKKPVRYDRIRVDQIAGPGTDPSKHRPYGPPTGAEIGGGRAPSTVQDIIPRKPQYKLVSQPPVVGRHAAPRGVPHPDTPPAAQIALGEAQAVAVPHTRDSNVPTAATVVPNAPMAVSTQRQRPGKHAAPKGGGSVGRALNTLDPTASLGPAATKRPKGGAHRAPKPSTAAKVSKFMGVDAPQAAGAPKRAPMAASVRKNPRKSPAAPPANAPARTPGPQPGLASKVKRIAGKAGAGLGVGMAALAAANQAQKDSTLPSAIRRPAKGGKHAAAKAGKHARPSAAVIPASVRGGAHQKKRS